MVSKYFELKMSREDFKRDTANLIESLKGKRILIYGAGAGFLALENAYKLTEKLDVIGISDRKFNKTGQSEFNGIKALPIEQISKEDFDYILVTNEQSRAMVEFLYAELGIKPEKVKTIINEKIKDEVANMKYLEENNFYKNLPKLIKSLKNKKVVFYGAGSFFETIKEYFDLSELNVIGISDKKFSKQDSESEFLGYKTIPPEKIRELKPDYVLVTTKIYVRIIENLHDDLLKKSGIKIKPLLKKPFIVIYKEIRDI